MQNHVFMSESTEFLGNGEGLSRRHGAPLPRCAPHCFVSHIRRGPESIYTGERLRHREPLTEELFASGVVGPSELCGHQDQQTGGR